MSLIIHNFSQPSSKKESYTYFRSVLIAIFFNASHSFTNFVSLFIRINRASYAATIWLNVENIGFQREYLVVLRPKFPRSLGLWLILYRVTNGSPIVRKHFNLPRHRIDSVTEYRGRSCALRFSRYGINRAAHSEIFIRPYYIPVFSCIIKFNIVRI